MDVSDVRRTLQAVQSSLKNHILFIFVDGYSEVLTIDDTTLATRLNWCLPPSQLFANPNHVRTERAISLAPLGQVKSSRKSASTGIPKSPSAYRRHGPVAQDCL
jgi:hypothetical protein